MWHVEIANYWTTDDSDGTKLPSSQIRPAATVSFAAHTITELFEKMDKEYPHAICYVIHHEDCPAIPSLMNGPHTRKEDDDDNS